MLRLLVKVKKEDVEIYDTNMNINGIELRITNYGRTLL